MTLNWVNPSSKVAGRFGGALKSRTGFIPLVLVIWIAGSAAAKSQDKNGTAEPRVLIIGVVDKIDTKGKSLTLTHAISLVVDTPNDANAGGTTWRGSQREEWRCGARR